MEAAMAARLVTLAEASERTTLSRRQIYRQINAGDFPRPIRISKRRIAFSDRQLDQYVERLIQRGQAA